MSKTDGNQAISSRRLIAAGIAAVGLALAACDGTRDRVGAGDGGGSGGGGGGGGGDGGGGTQVKQLLGIMLAPEDSEQASLRYKAVAAGATTKQEDSCPGDVPSGYQRLQEVELVFLDAAGQETGETLATDECGVFSGEVSEETASLRAEPDGLRPIESSVEVFETQDENEDPTIVSTIDENANYEIRSLFRQSDDRFGFTVVDDQSGRPVIGIPEDRFTLEVADTEVGLESVVVAAQTAESAAVSLVLDASGSMNTNIVVNDEGDDLTRLHLTRDAAQLFLDEKGAADEAGFVIFDSSVNTINDDFIDQSWDIVDANGDPASYSFSQSGFSTSAGDLRLIADAYSPFSEVYENTDFGTEQARHPDTPGDLSIANNYVWGGGTSLWEAVEQGVTGVSEDSQATRKAVITMGDGGDTTSRTVEEAIDFANDRGVPVFAIGFGLGDPEDDSAAADLEQLGVETGGGYTGVDDADAETELLAAFENLQIGIVFQYIATLVDNTDVQEGDEAVLKLSYNGVEAERSFTVPARD